MKTNAIKCFTHTGYIKKKIKFFLYYNPISFHFIPVILFNIQHLDV